jgi:hypothetical protein
VSPEIKVVRALLKPREQGHESEEVLLEDWVMEQFSNPTLFAGDEKSLSPSEAVVCEKLATTAAYYLGERNLTTRNRRCTSHGVC